MYDDEPYNEAELDVIQHVAEDIEDLENGRASRRRAYVSRGEGDRLDVNISTKYTNQKLGRLPLAILSKVYRNLHRIELSGNDLGTSGLPTQFEKCGGLYYLKLEYCNLTGIPDVICRLNTLVVLDISHNQLSRLPLELQDLKQLRVLSLSHNQFRELPTFLTRVGSLKTIDVTGNPLEAPPRSVWDNALPQNRGLDGLERTRRILSWLAERRPQTSSSADCSSPEPIRPGSLVPQPLNLTKGPLSPLPTIVTTTTTSTTRSNMVNRNGSMDTTYSDAAMDAPEFALNINHAIYVARKTGKAYYQLVQHIRAELRVAGASGTMTNVDGEFLGFLQALDECARDLIAFDHRDGGIDAVKSLIYCGSQLLHDVLRSFMEDVAPIADLDLLDDIPLLFEMVDKNVVSALQDIGVRFAVTNNMENVTSLYRISSYGSISFTYANQPQSGAITVRIPELRSSYAPTETSASSLSYASSAMNSSTDLQQVAKVEDEPYELIGEVIGNCTTIWQELNAIHVKGYMQATPPIYKLWNDTLVAVQQLEHRAKVLHNHLAHYSAIEIATLREPFDALSNMVLILRKLLNKLSKNSNLVSEQTMTAYKVIKGSVTTAMRLLQGGRNSAVTPTSALTVTSAGSASSYAPATPLNAALGPAAARMVGKDTSSLFKKIEDFHRNQKRF